MPFDQVGWLSGLWVQPPHWQNQSKKPHITVPNVILTLTTIVLIFTLVPILTVKTISNSPSSILPSNLSSQESQLVGNVDTGSPAEAAGVKKGDKIIEVRQVFKDNRGESSIHVYWDYNVQWGCKKHCWCESSIFKVHILAWWCWRQTLFVYVFVSNPSQKWTYFLHYFIWLPKPPFKQNPNGILSI